MKYFVLVLALAAMPLQAKEQETKKTDTPEKVKVCVDVQDKNGKPVLDKNGKPRQDCKTMKKHKKHEGTKIPDKK